MIIKANDPQLKSWVNIPPDSDFPIQNLPFGVFKTSTIQVGVAIGSMVMDLNFVQAQGYLDELHLPENIFDSETLNNFFALGKTKVREVRERISTLLQHDHSELRDSRDNVQKALIPIEQVKMLMPLNIPNYTDFYSSIEHATNVGSIFRDPEKALLPNWRHMPVAYHGRASSIVVSGTPVHRPKGQIKIGDDLIFGATEKLDFELEVAFVACQETALGQAISTLEADKYIVGFVLFNDWSARDIQQWEYVPLGPFLGKNFASTISPWIVTMDALEPFRISGPVQRPSVLPYLDFNGERNFDINLEVILKPKEGEGTRVCFTNAKYLYWNVFQQLAHHTVNGCNIKVGDVFASGTISGPTADAYGSMLEMTVNGKQPILLNGRTNRKFIEDFDTVIFKGYAEKNGVRIGFGECKGQILPTI